MSEQTKRVAPRLALAFALLALAHGTWAVWKWASEPIKALPPAQVECRHLGPCSEGPVLGGVPVEQRFRR